MSGASSDHGTPARTDPGALLAFTREALAAAGLREDLAHSAGRCVWLATMRGVDSHGVRLLPHYAAGLAGGRLAGDPDVRFTRGGSAVGVLDADHTMGHAACAIAMEHAADMAREAGLGLVSVRNSSHCGALAAFTLRAAEAGMIGLSATHATAKLLSAHGTRPFFGTNPFCVVAPMAGEGPFCFDSAISTITMNRVYSQRETGEPLPAGVAADDEGRVTTDPREAVQLLPIGGYKGFGLSMAVDMLCGVLAGMPTGRGVSRMFDDPMHEHRLLGQVVAAVRIDAFDGASGEPPWAASGGAREEAGEGAGSFDERLAALAGEVRREPALDGDRPVLVPGDPEKRTHAERARDGVPLPRRTIAALDTLAGRLGIASLTERGATDG